MIGLGVRVSLFAGALVVCALLPSWLGVFRTAQLAYVGIYFIAILGVNLVTGYTGQISLGHGAFMAIGGYTTAILVADHGVKDYWTLGLAGLAAGVAGLLFGLPALRLRGLYLALATFAIAVALPTVLRYEELDGATHGTDGINLFGVPDLTASITPLEVFGHQLVFEDWLYYLTWTTAAVLFVVAWLLLRNRPGRAWVALRDSEAAAASSGVSPATWKTAAFAVSAFYAGVAGGLYALATTFVNPQTYPVTLSLTLVVGAVVAGLGSLWGILAGALLVQFLRDDLVGQITTEPGAGDVVYGGLLILVMLLLPGGLAGLLRSIASPVTSRTLGKS